MILTLSFSISSIASIAVRILFLLITTLCWPLTLVGLQGHATTSVEDAQWVETVFDQLFPGLTPEQARFIYYHSLGSSTNSCLDNAQNIHGRGQGDAKA